MKKLNDYKLEIDGEYPKFIDSYVSWANWEDGTELSEEELEELNEDQGFILELVYKFYF